MPQEPKLALRNTEHKASCDTFKTTSQHIMFIQISPAPDTTSKEMWLPGSQCKQGIE